MHYGVTGARKLNKMEVEQMRYELWELDRDGTCWHIGMLREWIKLRETG
jgi:hypothetical protein